MKRMVIALALVAGGCGAPHRLTTDQAIKACGRGNVASVNIEAHKFECKR